MTPFTYFSGVADTKGKQITLPFGDLIRHFNDFSVGTDKKKLAAFSPAIFKNEGRRKANVEQVSGLVLDFDGSQSIGEGLAPFEDQELRYILYSTFNHRRAGVKNPTGNDRFRLIIPLKEPIPSSDYPALWKWAEMVSGSKIDPACKSPNQVYFMPGVADLDSDFEFLANEHGKPLDWKSLSLAEYQTPAITHVVTENRSIPRLALQIMAGQVDIGGKYPSRSELDMALICSLHRGGHDLESIKALFAESRHDSRYRELLTTSPASAEAYLVRSLEKAKGLGESKQFAQSRSLATEFRRQIERMPWKGRSSENDRAVLLAHIALAERAGKVQSEYHASVRDIALEAAMGKGAASNATRRLINLGFIRPVNRGKGFAGSVYELVVSRFSLDGKFHKVDTQSQKLSRNTECPVYGKIEGIFDDPRYGGLGKVAKTLYLTLLRYPQGMTATEMVNQTGKSLGSVYGKLRQLETFKLVSKEGRRYYAVQDVDFASLGNALGTMNNARQRQGRAAKEREQYRNSALFGKFHDPVAGQYFRKHIPEMMLA